MLLAHIPECERIFILDRRPPSAAVLAGISKVEFIEHQLGVHSEEALAAAMANVDCVFSCVTPDVELGTERAFYMTNLDGVKTIIRACVVAGVPRLVHMSSIAVSNHFVESFNQTEADPLPPLATYKSPYDISKRLGEEAVLQAAHDGKLAACALRSGGIVSSHTDFVFRYAFKFPGIVIAPSRSSSKDGDYIDVRDVSRALLLAATALKEQPSKVNGEVFWATQGETWRHQDMCELVAKELGYPFVPVSHIVFGFARALFAVPYFAKKALGFDVPGIPPQLFITMCYFQKTFDNSKIKEVLGFWPKIPSKETFKRIAALRLEAEGHFWSWPQAGLLCSAGTAIFLSVLGVIVKRL